MYNFCKRLFDIVCSFIALLVLALPMLVLAIIIRRSSKSSAIFSQERTGKNAVPFILYKFRTMTADADPFGPSPKAGTDPRLTKIGAFLRELSIDELPQLWNVLKGDMSLVGPRPLYVAQISEWNDEQKKRLLVKPGLTGLAQISGRGNLTREEKLDLDAKYVQIKGPWTDLKIIFATMISVLCKKSIYEKRYSKHEETRGK